MEKVCIFFIFSKQVKWTNSPYSHKHYAKSAMNLSEHKILYCTKLAAKDLPCLNQGTHPRYLIILDQALANLDSLFSGKGKRTNREFHVISAGILRRSLNLILIPIVASIESNNAVSANNVSQER